MKKENKIRISVGQSKVDFKEQEEPTKFCFSL